MSPDFEIGGRKFKLSKIDPLKQFHVARRISPILADMLPAMKGLQKASGTFDQLPSDEKLDKIASVVGPFMKGLSQLSDKDAELVLFSLLQAVEVQQLPAKNWARVATDSMIMMQDLDLSVLMQAAGRAFMFNLSSFFQGPPQ
jgi:hypothetical protein